MWKDDKKQKPQGTPSILVRKKPIPTQSFQNSTLGKEFEIHASQKPSSSTSSTAVANNNKENYGKTLQSALILVIAVSFFFR